MLYITGWILGTVFVVTLIQHQLLHCLIHNKGLGRIEQVVGTLDFEFDFVLPLLICIYIIDI
jgi:hypothetical protein